VLKYEVSPEEALQHAEELVRELAAHGILRAPTNRLTL
jgi:hypothetical protein